MQLLNNNDGTPINPNNPPETGLDALKQETAQTPTSVGSPVDRVQMGSDGETAANDEQSLIQKLLQEKQATERKTTKVDALKKGQKRSLSESEVANMRYKVFSLGLLALGAILWSSFVYPSINDYGAKRQTLATTRTETQQATTAIQTAQKLNSFAGVVETNSGAFTDCINTESPCDDITTQLVSHVSDGDAARKQAQYYLQIGDLSDPKLLVDERSILTNIDLFLLRYGPDNKPQRGGANRGEITSVIISDPVQVQGKTYSVDIELVVEFPNDTSLINFLNNAENRIISNDVISLPPILYKVQEVGYDIAKHTESQETTVKLTAYYYTDTTN